MSLTTCQVDAQSGFGPKIHPKPTQHLVLNLIYIAQKDRTGDRRAFSILHKLGEVAPPPNEEQTMKIYWFVCSSFVPPKYAKFFVCSSLGP